MMFYSLLIATLSVFTVLSWRDQKFGILILFALLPTYLVRFSIGSIPTTLLECLALITIGMFLIRSDRSQLAESLSRVWRSLGWYRIPLVVTTIAAVLSTLVAPNLISALGILKAYFIEPALLAFVVKSVMHERKDITQIIDALIVSGSVIGLLAIVQVLFHFGIPDAWFIENRATSLYDYPNAVGLFLAPIVVMGMVRYFTHSNSPFVKKNEVSDPSPSLRRRGLGGGLILIMLGGIVAAKTEAALVAIPVALFVIALIAPIHHRIKAGIVAASIIGTLVVASVAPSILQKITLQDSSGLVRRAQWSETLHMLADRPFFGAGLSGYAMALIPYHDATFYEIFQYPHNIILNMWSELGLLGVLALIAGLILLARTTWRRKNDPLILCFSAAILTMIIHGLVDVPFFKNDLAILTAFCLLGMTVPRQTPSSAAQSS